MLFRSLMASSVALLTMLLVLSGNVEGGKEKEKDKEKPSATIKEVMKKAHGKDGLLAKVSKGDASKEDKKALVDLYVALGANTPPKGDAAAWKDRTEALIKAAKDDDGKALKKAADCMACHSEFKGKKAK